MERPLKTAGTTLVVLICLFIVLCITGVVSPMRIAISFNWPLAASVLSKMGLTNKLVIDRNFSCVKPLQLAAEQGNARIVDILLDDGADIKATFCPHLWDGGKTVLEAAVLYPALVKHLIDDRDIDANLKNLAGNTALSATLDCNGKRISGYYWKKNSKHELMQSLEILLAAGTDPNLPMYHPELVGQMPPLALAALSGCPEAVETLLRHKADAVAAGKAVDAQLAKVKVDPFAEIPLTLALEEQRDKSVKLIKEAAGK